MDKCMVTHNVIEEPKVRKSEWDNDKISFVSLGRYAPIKRFDLMLRLFAEFVKENKDAELYLFGDKIDNVTLSELANQLGISDKVYFHNEITNVHEELIKHSVYLMTSLQEGFPNALSEALAVGLPAIVIGCHDGIKQLVRNGENGFCVSEGDETGFVSAMSQLADNISLRKTMGIRSVEIARQYAQEVIMKEWEACIEKAKMNRLDI